MTPYVLTLSYISRYKNYKALHGLIKYVLKKSYIQTLKKEYLHLTVILHHNIKVYCTHTIRVGLFVKEQGKITLKVNKKGQYYL